VAGEQQMTPAGSGVPAPSPAARHGRVIVLQDHRAVLVRPVRPGDREALAEAFRRLSSESRRLRFGSVPRSLGAAALRWLIDSVDGTDHVAFAAFPDDEPTRLVGVARILRYPDDPDSLDVGVTVADDYQGSGLGTVFAGLLAAQRPRPARRVITHVAADNRRVMALLTAFGAPHRDTDGRIIIDLEDQQTTPTGSHP
jgi:RimJ/RimL family protein N-acetyltransferase